MGSAETPQEKPEGERWLELIGYGDLIGQPTGRDLDGQPVPAEQFDKLCEYVRPIFRGIEGLDPKDPKYEPSIALARKFFDGYFNSTETKT